MNQQEYLTQVSFFKDKLFRLAKRMLISREEAEDALQEVLLKLWKTNRESLKNMESMAMVMTKNYCLDQLKSKRSQNIRLLHSNYEDNQSLEMQIVNNDSLNHIDEIINNLPEQQKIIIQLREIEAYEFEEIAKILNMNETAIRVSLSRARKTLKAQYQKIQNHGIT